MTPTDEPPADDLWLLDGQVVLLGRASLERYADALQSSLPAIARRMELRGHDWIGRPIGVARHDGSVLLYDGAFAELMEFDAPGGMLTASPLFDAAEDNFGAVEHAAFLSRAGTTRLAAGMCAGFTVPPQLGGEVSACNLELYEVPVYWRLLSVLQDALGSLPEGALLRSIELV